jgi:hypothetical protein
MMHVDLMRDNARIMPDLSGHDGIESLCVWHCKYKTLEPIGQIHGLRTLAIATFPDDSFSILSSQIQLRYLSIVHLPKITDLSPLISLVELECLSLRTLPSWDASSKKTIVKSLEPLVELPKLKYLELFGVVPESRSLDAIEKCRNLVSVRVSQYPRKEMKRFYGVASVSDDYVPKPDWT